MTSKGQKSKMTKVQKFTSSKGQTSTLEQGANCMVRFRGHFSETPSEHPRSFSPKLSTVNCTRELHKSIRGEAESHAPSRRERSTRLARGVLAQKNCEDVVPNIDAQHAHKVAINSRELQGWGALSSEGAPTSPDISVASHKSKATA